MAGLATLVDDCTTKQTGLWDYDSAVLANGAMRLPCGSSVQDQRALTTYDLTGGANHVYAAVVPSTGGVGAHTALVLASSTTGTDMRVDYDNDAGLLYFEINNSGTDGARTSVTYDPVAHKFWQIAGGSTAVNFQTSPDGSTWTTRRSAPYPGAGYSNAVTPALTTYNTSGASTNSIWSNINTLSGGPSVTVTATPKAETLSDPFNGSSVNSTLWGTQGTVTESGGVVSIVSAGSGFPSIHSLLSYDLTASHYRARIPVFPQDVGDEATFVVNSPTAGTDLRIVAANNSLTAKADVGYADAAPITVAISLSQPLTLQVIEATGTVRWQYSLDGVTWTTIRSMPTPAWLNLTTLTIGADNVGTGVVVGSGGSFSIGSGAPPTGGSVNATVDFRTAVYPLDAYSFGSCLSTYNGGGQGNINKNATWKSMLAALGPIAWRIPLRYNGGNPGSSAGGGQTSGDAGTYIANIKSIGGVPVVVMGGDSADNGFSNTDFAGLVHYFNDSGGQHGGPVHRWVVGNEPDNGGGGTAYLAALDAWIAAAKAADSSILVSAPAAAYWDQSLVSSAAGHSGVDVLSYHAYDGGNTDSTGFPATIQYYNNVVTMRGYKAGIIYGVEEFNWHYNYSSMSAFYDWHNACFVASVIGQVLKAGGHAYHYSDSNGPLGLLNDGSGQNGQVGSFATPFPAYYGIGMWTGMNGTFRGAPTQSGTGHIVSSSSTVANVDIFGMDNGKIIAINKDTADHTVNIALGGVTAGTAVIWQTVKTTTGAMPAPTQKTSVAYTGGILTITLPQGTITSVEL